MILFCLACSQPVEVEPLTLAAFVYDPDVAQVTIAAGHFRDFEVRHSPDPIDSVNWQINGNDVGLGPRYRYFPSVITTDTLVATALSGDHTGRRTWLIASMNEQPTNVDFAPLDDLIEFVLGDTGLFSAVSNRAAQSTYRWERGGLLVSEAASYLATATAPGTDTLQVTVTAADHTATRTWELRQYEPGQQPPLAPRDFFAESGPAPGTVTASWHAALPRGTPVTDYELAISYDGPIVDSNWNAAVFLAQVPALSGQEICSISLSDTTNGMTPGAHGWLGIRSVNSAGIRSAHVPNREIDISEPWWASGTTVDDTGRPLANVTIRTSTGTHSTQSHVDGTYRIGPFHDTEQITLRTETPDVMPVGQQTGAWVDANSGPLSFHTVRNWDFLLVTLYNLLSDCTVYNGNFPTFLRAVTHTERGTDLRPNQNLYKWESYPVPVWVPDYISPEGYEYARLCRQVVAMWNETMAAEFLNLVDDPADARIAFRFGDDGNATLGKTTLLEPSDHDYGLGDIVPQKVEVYVRDRLNAAQFVQEVAMHELGHALGLVRHITCSDGSYLMYFSPAGRLDGAVEDAINPDERHALRMIRALPQGFDMSLMR